MVSTQTWVANTEGKASADPLAGTEIIRVDAGGTSKKSLISSIVAYAAGLANTWALAQTFSVGIVLGAGSYFDADSAAVSATGNDTTQTATVAKAAGTITTGALTTAAGGTTAVVLTLTGVAAGDLVFVTKCGGTNTRSWDDLATVTTTNTITVTISNLNLISALNGTVKFNYFWMKA